MRTHFLLTHTPFVKYYLSRWFSIFQNNRYSHLTRHFPVLWGGNLNMAGENTDSFHTHCTLVFHKYSNICSLIDILWGFTSPFCCHQSGSLKAWREHYYSSNWTAWGLFFILRHVLVKKRSAPYPCRSLFFFSSTGFIKMSCASVQQLSADCVTSVFCSFIMSCSFGCCLKNSEINQIKSLIKVKDKLQICELWKVVCSGQ